MLNCSLNRKITQNKTKHLLVENEFKKLKTFDLSYFIGKSYFEEDSTPNYLIFQPFRYFKLNVKNGAVISSWKSKGLSAETIEPPTSNIGPELDFYGGGKLRVNFIGGYLKQSNKSTYFCGIIVNIYIVYEVEASSSNINDPPH